MSTGDSSAQRYGPGSAVVPTNMTEDLTTHPGNANQETSQSDAKFRTLAERTVVGLYLIQGGRFKYVNPRMAELFGYEVAELIEEKDARSLVHPDDWPRVDKYLRRRPSHEAANVDLQFRGIRKNGDIIHCEVFGSRMDYNGRPAIIGTLLDVSRQISAAAELDAELKKFRALYELALAMTAQRSLEENLSLVVEKSRELLGGDTSYIALSSEEDSEVFMHTVSGITTEAFMELRIPLGSGLGGKVAASGTGHIIEDYYREIEPLLHDVVRGEGLISGVAAPIQIGNHNLGVLYVFNRTKTSFSKSDLDTLSLLGNLAAVEIERKRTEWLLRKAHDELEQRVEVRTGELKRTNEKLLLEITDRIRAEEALKETEKRYRHLVESASDIIYQTDPGGYFTLVNPVILKITGYSDEEFIGKHYLDLVHPDHREEIARFYRDQFVERVPETYCEVPVVTKNGRTAWFGLNVQLLMDGDQVVGFQSIARDVSDRKRAEEALRDSQEQYRKLYEEANQSRELYLSLLNASPDPIVVYDVHGTPLYMNPAFTRVFGWTFEEIASGTINFVPPDNWPETEEMLNKVLNGISFSNQESRRFARDGRVLDVSISAAVFFDSRGRTAGSVIHLRDITEAKKAEELLRESEDRYRKLYEQSQRAQEIYRSLLNSTPDAIVIYDMAGKPQYVNDSFTHLFGWTLEEIQGHRIEFVPESELEVTMSIVNRLVDKGIPCSHLETKRYTRDRRLLDISLTGSRFNDHEGNPAGMLVILRDISSRKRAEEMVLQSERLTAVGELASGVAHNFNNLLQVTMGIAGLALINLDSGNLEKVQAYLNRILESSRFGAETVRRLQDFARIRSDRTVEAEEVFDLSQTVDKSVEISQTWWQANPVKSDSKISLVKVLGQDCFVRGHENELFEVVINLMKNAAEALPDGGEIRISTSVEGDWVALKVSDNGVGIPKQFLGKVFEPFWTTKGYQGTGMGLASSLGIVSRYKGQIFLDSQEGLGTTVTVKLPLGKPVGHIAAVHTSFEHRPSLRILAIDDAEPVIEMLQEGLEEFGHQVAVATSGPKAIELFEGGSFDLVICDLAMPGMSGWQVARTVKKICEDKTEAKIPFILLTGWGGQLGEERKIAECGVDAVVEKPVDMLGLLRVIEDVVCRTFAQSK